MGLFRKPFLEFPLGCFGKLPGYADFARLDLDSRLSQTLREWLTGAAPEGHGPETLSHAARFFLNGGKRGLAGVVAGSEDSHGRRFPFAAFAELSVDAIGRTAASALHAIDATWRQLEGILRGLSPLPVDPPLVPTTSLGELYGTIRTAKVRIPRDALDASRPEAWLARAEVAAFAEEFGAHSALTLEEAVARLVTYIRSQSPRDLRGAAFRVPYGFGQGYLVQAAFWSGLVHACAKDLPVVPTWFSPVAPELGNRGLWICFREPNGLDARVLLGMEATHEHVFDLSTAARREGDPAASALPDGLRTLEQLLRHACSHP